MTEQDLLSMKVGDSVFNPRIGHIHRVVGGWVYQFVQGGVFVPYPKTSDVDFKNEIETKSEDEEQGGKKRGRKPILTK